MAKADKLDQIAQDILASGITPQLAETANQLVFGTGAPSARVMLIGEAPGAKEDLTGRPFVGAAGKFLDALLASIELEREDVYITNIVKYRPPGNRDPKPAEIAAFEPYLQQQIEVINPKVLVTLGRHAMKVLQPDLLISEAHGRVYELDGRKFIPLYHPAAALYNPGLRQLLFNDFQSINQVIDRA